jgi:hypothetical protein
MNTDEHGFPKAFSRLMFSKDRDRVCPASLQHPKKLAASGGETERSLCVIVIG